MKTAFIIPVYKHGSTLESVIEGLSQFNLPFIVVDDGNDEQNRVYIEQCAKKHSEVTLVSYRKNHGKGFAMSRGILKAHKLGFTHIFQVDADGQHDVNACHIFLEASKKAPEAVINGYPQYDESVPQIRKGGREFSNNWGRICSLDFSIKDVLCGFRIYPVEPFYKLLRHHAYINHRMGYDVDILVHLSWLGLKTINLPVIVTYPKDGISNYRMVRDNIGMSLTFARLCLGMFIRLPKLLLRKVRKDKSKASSWNSVNELSKSGFSLKFTLFLVKIFPHSVLIALTKFVSFFYFIFCKNARNYSRTYQQTLIEYCKNLPEAHKNTNLSNVPKTPAIYSHICSFAMTIVEKMEGWCHKKDTGKLAFNPDDTESFRKNFTSKKGCVIFVSHLGNVELIRSIVTSGHFDMPPDIPMAIIMDQHVTKKFNSMMKNLNSNSNQKIISTDDIGIETIDILQETIEQGGLVIIAGDRISANSPGRKITLSFLGKKADFPYGPFLIASLLKAPTYFVFSLRKKQLGPDPTYSMNIVESKTDFDVSRKERETKIMELAGNYVYNLEKFCIENPVQWYNFYSYFHE